MVPRVSRVGRGGGAEAEVTKACHIWHRRGLLCECVWMEKKGLETERLCVPVPVCPVSLGCEFWFVTGDRVVRPPPPLSQVWGVLLLYCYRPRTVTRRRKRYPPHDE